MDRRKFLTVAGSGALVGLTGCGGCKKTGDKVIKIYSSMPRTGSAKGQTDTIVNGIQMAIAEYNDDVAGFKIEYTDLDDANAALGDWTAEAETTNAEKAAADPHVMVFIGPYNSGAASMSAPILNQAGILQISPACTAPGLTKPGFKVGEPKSYQPSGKRNFCRVVPTDDIQSLVGATFIRDYIKKKSVVLLDDRSHYGKGVADLFEKVAKDVGLNIIHRDDIDRAATDYKGLMQTLATKYKPEVIYFGGTTQTNAGQVVKDMKSALPACQLVAPDGCYEKSFINSAGDAINGRVFVTFGGLDPTKLTGPGKKFVDAYTTKYKNTPEVYAIYGYESAKVAMEAIKKAGKKDRDAIREAGLATKDFDQGALGKWSFDENGDTTQAEFTVSIVENNDFKPVDVFTGERLAKLRS